MKKYEKPELEDFSLEDVLLSSADDCLIPDFVEDEYDEENEWMIAD